MKKRICLLFSALFVLSVLCFLPACGKSESDIAENKPEAESPDEMPPQEAAEEAPVLPEITEQDYEGYEFRFLTKNEDWAEWQSVDISAEEMNGENINDAVYMRNSVLEDKFNILIVEKKVNAPHDNAKKSVKAGEDSFDAVVSGMNNIVEVSQEGLLMDQSNIPHMNLSNPWWDQKGVAELELGGKVFCVTGDLFVTDKDATWVMMFNKQLAQDYQIEDPYSLVRSGQWTMDKFAAIIRDVSADLNGDGIMDENDFYGFSTHEYSSWGFLYGAGIKIAEKDLSGYPALVMNAPTTQEVMEKTVEIMTNGIYAYCKPVGDWAKALKVFEEDRAIFYGEVLQCAIRLRQMVSNFGLIPYPKYDAAQETYPCMVNDVATVLGVPVTTTETERTGTILEYMSYLSRIYLKPAYYEVALKGKFMRDEESGEMLDLIMRDRVFDLGYIFNWGGLASNYCSSVMKKSADFASMYEKYEARALEAVEKLVAAYESLE